MSPKQKKSYYGYKPDGFIVAEGESSDESYFSSSSSSSSSSSFSSSSCDSDSDSSSDASPPPPATSPSPSPARVVIKKRYMKKSPCIVRPQSVSVTGRPATSLHVRSLETEVFHRRQTAQDLAAELASTRRRLDDMQRRCQRMMRERRRVVVRCPVPAPSPAPAAPKIGRPPKRAMKAPQPLAKLCNLRGVRVATLHPEFICCLRSLRPMFPTDVSFAQSIGVARSTVKEIMGGDRDRPPAPRVRSEKKEIKAAAIMTAASQLATAPFGLEALQKKLEENGAPVMKAGYIRHVLKQNSFNFKKEKKIPLLNENHKKQRVEMCKKVLEMSDETISSILFSDEKIFRIYEHNRSGLWCAPGVNHLVEGRREVRGTMVWMAIGFFQPHLSNNNNSKKNKATINPYCSRPVFIDGNLDKDGYEEVLKEILVPFLIPAPTPDKPNAKKLPFLFQQDNAPCHKAESIIQFFTDNGIQTLKWSPCSPDLNVIENIWSWLKQKIGSGIQTKAELEEKIIKLLMTAEAQEAIKNNLESFKRRCALCVELNGEYTGY